MDVFQEEAGYAGHDEEGKEEQEEEGGFRDEDEEDDAEGYGGF